MSALTYYLLQNPQALHRLQDELRHTFRQHTEIDGESTKSLTYLNAVIEEGMRVFAPAPFGLPRVSPGAEVTGEWIPKGTVISTAAHVTSRDERWFYKAKEFHPERWLSHEHHTMSLSSPMTGKRLPSPFLLAHDPALAFTYHIWRFEFVLLNWLGALIGNR
ncbi:Cytochrome P450 monooxygenase BOA3 [Colletotrichum aenigma]|uniref:Cytochrome P450 monooxygenase BOA3 n=1 Tax=Colletotrichum aenigma TaxID=1215731 RepID=UPI0018728C3E|nr:Cytochrome P450 monooxygenase BOA3 [Colletotrichum aenigma]KAF5517659.1 Cytochrome P450 monooxygenase BOA3 [Colletotrichum aenigma]